MINVYKKKSGAKKFVACLGKSNLSNKKVEYKIIEQIAEILINENLGIIHGGYGGGAMQAINEGADRAIKEQGKNIYLNIGAPFKVFEKDWPRVPYGVFLKPAEILSERIDNIILNSDIIVVLPKGGFGTMLEVIYSFHLNQIQKGTNGKIRLIIFYGDKWKLLINRILKELDTKSQSSGKEWCYFVNSLMDFKKTIKRLINI